MTRRMREVAGRLRNASGSLFRLGWREPRDFVIQFGCFTAALALGFGALLIAHVSVSYHHFGTVTLSRSGDVTAVPEDAGVAWMPVGDALESNQPIDVVFLKQLDPAAAPPPGLPRWPLAGEVFLSPALSKAGEAEGIAQRYGTAVGHIAPEGLVDPTELRAYVGVADFTGDRYLESPKFGMAPQDGAQWIRNGWWQSNSDLPTRTFVLGGLFSFVVLPAALVAVLLGSMDAKRRAKQAGVLAVLGAGAGLSRVIRLAQVMRPVAWSGAVLAAAIAAVMTWGVQVDLPWVTVSAATARASWYVYVLALAAAIIVTMGCLVVGRARLSRGNRPRVRESRLAVISAWLFPVFLILGVRAIDLFYPSSFVLVAYVIGLLGVIVTLPGFLAVVAAAVGRHLAAAGRSRGWVTGVLTGSWLRAHRTELARGLTALVGVVILLVQLQAVQSRSSFLTADAAAVNDAAAGRLVRVDSTDLALDISALDDAAPLGALPILVVPPTGVGPGQDIPTLVASCAALQAASLDCEPGLMSASDSTIGKVLRAALYSDAVAVSPTQEADTLTSAVAALDLDVRAALRTVLYVSPDGGGLDVNPFKQFAFTGLTTIGQASYIGGSEAQGWVAQQYGAWLGTLAAIAIVAFALAITLRLVELLATMRHYLAPLGALTCGRARMRATSVLLVAAPMVVAAWGSLPPALGLTNVLKLDGAHIAMTPIWVMVCAVSVLAAAMGVANMVRLERDVQAWRPGSDT